MHTQRDCRLQDKEYSTAQGTTYKPTKKYTVTIAVLFFWVNVYALVTLCTEPARKGTQLTGRLCRDEAVESGFVCMILCRVK